MGGVKSEIGDEDIIVGFDAKFIAKTYQIYVFRIRIRKKCPSCNNITAICCLLNTLRLFIVDSTIGTMPQPVAILVGLY